MVLALAGLSLNLSVSLSVNATCVRLKRPVVIMLLGALALAGPVAIVLRVVPRTSRNLNLGLKRSLGLSRNLSLGLNRI